MVDDRPLREGQILAGPLFSEPMRVETIRPSGPDMWIVGLVGIHTERFPTSRCLSRTFKACEFKIDFTVGLDTDAAAAFQLELRQIFADLNLATQLRVEVK